MNDPQQTILRLASKILELTHGVGEGPVSVVIVRGVVVTLGTEPSAVRAAPVSETSAIQRAILKYLTRTPATSRRLARLVGHAYDSHFRAQLRDLIDRDPPLARRTSQGYRLP